MRKYNGPWRAEKAGKTNELCKERAEVLELAFLANSRV